MFVHFILLFSIAFRILNIKTVLGFCQQLLFFYRAKFYIEFLISAIGGNFNVQYFVEWYALFLSFKKMVLAVKCLYDKITATLGANESLQGYTELKKKKSWSYCDTLI